MSSKEQNFYIKEGYIHRPEPEYFDDKPSGVIYQPDVYPLAARIGRALNYTHIVDIGCGVATKLATIHDAGFEIVGVDYGKNIGACRRFFPFGTWIEWDLESAGRIPFPDEIEGALTRSVIVCADVIEHLKDPTSLLANIHSIMEKAPVALISTPERDLARGEDHMGPPDNEAHVREWNIVEFKRLLLAEGLNLQDLGLTTSENETFVKQTILAILANDHSGGRRISI